MLVSKQGQYFLQLPGAQSLTVVNPDACGDRIGAKFKGRRLGNQVWIDGPA